MNQREQAYRARVLQSYAQPPTTDPRRADRLFRYVAAGTFLVLMSAGAYLFTVTIAPETPRALAQKIQARFVMNRPKPRPKPPVKKKVEDLTKKPKLAQKNTELQKKVITRQVKKTRRVYGLRKVYAKGLGSGSGNGSAAIVSKLGNTLEKEPDTLKATERDLKGPLVSVSTVTSAPSIVARAKPEYTKEMKENGVQGVVRAELLIDIDGTVKNIKLLNDLGYGSAASARAAFSKLKFKPAMRGDEPVAVKIIMKYRFVLQE